MGHFLAILHHRPDTFTSLEPEDGQRVIDEYLAWRRGVEAAGRMLGSNKLIQAAGRDVRLDGEQIRVTDGPYAEAKEVMGGYFLIEADDYDHAAAILADCPHLRYGTRIELRQVDFAGH